jgi:hypothetical protein
VTFSFPVTVQISLKPLPFPYIVHKQKAKINGNVDEKSPGKPLIPDFAASCQRVPKRGTSYTLVISAGCLTI